MKKSLIAAAVASVCAAPMAAQAEPEVWGEFIAGFESLNDDAAENDDGTMQIELDSANFGVETSEDLGNGLSAEAGTELDISGNDGDVDLDNTFAALSGDFGSVLLGWGVDSAFYLHVFEPVDRGIIYDTYLAEQGDESSQVVQYGYDGGAFQLTAEAVMDDSGDDAPDEAENFDRIGLGATFDAGVVSIGVGHQSVSEAADGANEPSSTGVSVGGEFGGVDVGAAYVMYDTDESGDGSEPAELDIAASMGFGGGLSGMLAFTDFDSDDGGADSSMVTANIAQALSSRTAVFGEIQSVDNDEDDAGDPQRLFVGVEHAF